MAKKKDQRPTGDPDGIINSAWNIISEPYDVIADKLNVPSELAEWIQKVMQKEIEKNRQSILKANREYQTRLRKDRYGK